MTGERASGLSSALVRKLGLILIYAAVAAVMVQPLVNFRELGSSSYEGDARFMIWTLAWNNHAVLHRLPLFDANTFFPAEHTLAYTDHLFGVSLFSLPIYAATGNPVLAYNVVWLHMTEHRADWPRRVLHLGGASALAGLLLLPFALPYRALPPVPVQQVARLSADVPAYLVPPENTWAGKLWLTYIGRGPRWIWGEQTLFLGYVALALALVGCAAAVVRREWRAYGGYVLLAPAGLWLSFGPSVVRGQEQWSLYGALSWLPGFSGFRAPARYAVLVVLSLSVLGAAGAVAIQRRFGRKGTFAVLAILPVMLSEWYILDFPGGKPQRFRTPAIYGLEPVQHARALVSLPDYRGTPEWYLGADYLLFSTTHWRRIVNGYGRAEPPGHPRVISHMNAFPGPNNAHTMRAIGVEYVVVHGARYADGARTLLDVAMASPEYELVERLGTDYLFRVKPGP